MAISITAVRPIMVAGSLVAVGGTASVDDALAQQLVFNGDATYTTPPTATPPAPGLYETFRSVTHTTVGGAASEAVTITGLLTTDKVQATVVDNNTNEDVVLLESKVTANTVTLLFNENPTAGVKVNIEVTRPL